MRRAGALLIINDHADIAVAVGADGVHLGQDDLPLADARKVVGERLLIGISTHTREQALAAEAGGAGYIGFGPVFPTATKDAGPLRGIDGLREVRSAVRIPVLAIGGITAANAEAVVAAGADGVAVISAVLDAKDPGIAARKILTRILPFQAMNKGA